MTREEVMALTNEELVAEAKRLTGRDKAETEKSLLGLPMYIVWDPVHDIAAAWELWSRLQQEGWWPVIWSATMQANGEFKKGTCVAAWHGTLAGIYLQSQPWGNEAREIARIFVLAMTQEAQSGTETERRDAILDEMTGLADGKHRLPPHFKGARQKDK